MNRIVDTIALSTKTSLRIGGPARHYCEPASREEVVAAVQWARERNLPILPLGRGSNVLVSDHGWPGLVINVSAAFTTIDWDRDRATARGGALLHTLVRQSVERGFQGIESLAGIPGTVAGAAVMNAGAFGGYIGAVIEVVDFVGLDDGVEHSSTIDQLAFGYRTSALQRTPCLVLAVGCRFAPGNPATLHETFEQALSKRKQRHPLTMPNCGSVFKNPSHSPAAALIERRGLKGYRLGGVEISSKHANFIVNRGGGTAEEFRALVRTVQKKIYEREGIVLEPEVKFVGRFEEELFEG